MRVYERWTEGLIEERLRDVTSKFGVFPSQAFLRAKEPRLFHAIYRLGFTMAHFRSSCGLIANAYSAGLKLPSLTYLQRSVIVGSLLGDGSLAGSKSHPNRNWHFKVSQSKLDHRGIDKLSYMKWLIDTLSPYSKSDIYRGKTKAKFIANNMKETSPSDYYAIRTCACPAITQMAREWYRNCDGVFERNDRGQVIKVIPQDLTLNSTAVTIWYMDDGSHVPTQRKCELYTLGFSQEETEYLCRRLHIDLGVVAHTTPSGNGHKIVVDTKSYSDFLELVANEIQWNCFHYKTDASTSRVLKGKARGCRIASSKLDESLVRDIRASKKRGCSNKDLSKEFGVSESAIWQIVNNKTWKHVKEEPS